MEGTDQTTHGHSNEGFPTRHLIGYVLSVVLTLGALWIAESTSGIGTIITLILLLAALQVAVQLYFFMHIAETPGPHFHIMALSLGVFLAATVVLGSMWIMAFGAHQAY
jgi:cytochrome aa3 quinol oxidase subunit IV